MTILRIFTFLAFVLASLAAFGVVLNQSVPNALGCFFLGLAAWVLSTLLVPAVFDRS